jgi:hypothetical protein
MTVFDHFALDLLHKLRGLIATMQPDAKGLIAQQIPGPQTSAHAFTLSVDKSQTLAAFDAAIARRTPSLPEALR